VSTTVDGPHADIAIGGIKVRLHCEDRDFLAGLGLIVNQVSATKEQATAAKEEANGKQGRLLDILERQGQMLAGMVPLTPDMARSWTSVDPTAIERGSAERSGQANEAVQAGTDQAVTDQVAEQTGPVAFGIQVPTPRVVHRGGVPWVELVAG
jgi:hypothetical protein